MKLEKVTAPVQASAPRRYDDACAGAHALDLIGERWAMLVLRELMLGPRRFGDLRASLSGLSANVLTQRLEGLEASGLVQRRKLPPPASVQVYELTEWGREAEPILHALGRWGARSPRHDPTLPFSAVALMMSLRAKFEPETARGADLSLLFRLGAEVFTVAVKDGVLTTERGEPARVDAEVVATPSAIAGLVYGKAPLEALPISVSGDTGALARLAGLYEMPAKAG